MSRYFWPILTPSTLSHLVTHPRTPQKYVTHLGTPGRSSTKNPDKSPLYKFSQLFARAFARGLLSGGLLSGRFCPGWFLSVPLLSEYICYNRKGLQITLTH